jgi:hypothetical protein
MMLYMAERRANHSKHKKKMRYCSMTDDALSLLPLPVCD